MAVEPQKYAELHNISDPTTWSYVLRLGMDLVPKAIDTEKYPLYFAYAEHGKFAVVVVMLGEYLHDTEEEARDELRGVRKPEEWKDNATEEGFEVLSDEPKVFKSYDRAF